MKTRVMSCRERHPGLDIFHPGGHVVEVPDEVEVEDVLTRIAVGIEKLAEEIRMTREKL